LTQDDFLLFDKGKRQTISSFSEVKHASARSGVQPRATMDTEAADQKLQPERHIVYVFDDLNIAFTDLAAV
jgi:hypothetical protein